MKLNTSFSKKGDHRVATYHAFPKGTGIQWQQDFSPHNLDFFKYSHCKSDKMTPDTDNVISNSGQDTSREFESQVLHAG
jgi:hypothetical protein